MIAIEISINEHLLKCHALIQKRLSGVGYYWPSSETPFKCPFASGPILADICKGVYV